MKKIALLALSLASAALIAAPVLADNSTSTINVNKAKAPKTIVKLP